MLRPRSGRRLDRLRQFGERYGDLKQSSGFSSEFVVAAAKILHECKAGDDDRSGTVAAQAAHRSQPAFAPAVIGVDAVAGVALDVMPGRRD